jgi:hypothetical protein
MKKLILMFALVIVASTFKSANAQVSLNINIGQQPQWGPRGHNYVDYYYLPDVHSYYHVPTKRFVYYEGSRWVHRKSLPKAYRHYNLYSGRKIVINEPRPYLQHNVYRTRYVETYRHDNGHHKGWNKKGKDHRGRH